LKVGTTLVNIVSDGTYLMDGGAVFGQLPRAVWELHVRPDRKNRIRLGINSLLVQMPGLNVLVDTGAGTKQLNRFKDDYSLNGNKLLREIKKHGLTARDIDVVVMTNLLFDQSGGCSKLDRSGDAVPTFPKAKYIVQKQAWEQAANPNERAAGSYFKDDFAPLSDGGVLKLVEGDTEIAPGVRTRLTGGPTSGHQIVLVEIGSARIAYVGKLMPTQYHVDLTCISAMDHDPNQTLDRKKELLKMALAGGWLLIFGNSSETCGAYIEQRNGKTTLQTVNI